MADLQSICVDNACMNNPICCNEGYFTGITDTTINVGDSFDPRQGVSAFDGDDNPIPFVASPDIDTSTVGTYYIAYMANGVDTVIRTITVEPAETFRTVLYPDGAFIINESSLDQSANEQLHGGTASYVYPALDANNNYVFTAYDQRPWHNEITLITSVEAGSPVAPTSCGYWFGNCTNILTVDMTDIDTSNCTAMNRMFSSCSRMHTINTEDMDVSSCTTMEMMFFGNAAMTEFNLCGWDTSLVTHMGQMFRNNTSLTKIKTTSDFVVTQVTQSNNMFAGDTSLVGGQGTAFDSNTVNKAYAKIDGGSSDKGYFTDCSGGGTAIIDGCRAWNDDTQVISPSDPYSYELCGTSAEDLYDFVNNVQVGQSVRLTLVDDWGSGNTWTTDYIIEGYSDSYQNKARKWSSYNIGDVFDINDSEHNFGAEFWINDPRYASDVVCWVVNNGNEYLFTIELLD